MNGKRISHIVFVLLLILVSGIATTPATAKGPTHFELPVAWSGRIDNPCGFKIDGTTTGSQRSTYWFDEEGTLVMGHNDFSITEIWEAGGKTLEFSYNYSVHGQVVTYPEYYTVWLGVDPIVTIPGLGAVIKRAGYYSEIYEMNKKGELVWIETVEAIGVDYADWPAICAYFAP